ncbi:MAG: hypothetical protein ACREVI_15005 [Steroidobacteraceae bacterium]
MSLPDRNRCRLALISGALALLAVAGCERPSTTEAISQRAPAPAVEAPVPTAPVPAPDPDDAMDGASYEVGIATAAANRKRAHEQCELRPETERDACNAGVEADWDVAKATVDDLRGEQQ